MMYKKIRFSDKRFTVKEHMTMAENLGDALSQILLNHMRKIMFNNRVRFELAKTASLVKNRVRREQLRFVDLLDNGKFDETDKEERLVRIMELKEEYENLRFRMFAPSLIDDDTDSQKWRCLFRTIRDRKTSMTIFDFVRIYNKWTAASADYLIYNKWTAASADYLILKALCDLECGEEKERSDIQIKLAEEYEVKIRKQEELLNSYFQDLHSIAIELDQNCNIFELLEDISDDEPIIQPTIIRRITI